MVHRTYSWLCAQIVLGGAQGTIWYTWDWQIFAKISRLSGHIL